MYYVDDKMQLSLEDFTLPFGGHLRKDNRWVQLATRNYIGDFSPPPINPFLILPPAG